MRCDWFQTSHCRSCDYLEYSYQESLLKKKHSLQMFFGDQDLKLNETIGLNEKIEGSRNKAKLAVYEDESGEILFGFYASNGSFKKLEDCPLHLSGINDLLIHLKKCLIEFKIKPYSLISKKGELKYLLISKSKSHNQLLLRMVIRSKESLDRLKKMTVVLQANITDLKVVTANIQPIHQAILEGDEEIILSHEDCIIHQYGDVLLFLGARSFFQVTPEIAEKLYSTVAGIVKKYSIQSFLDLYCGVGAFSYFAARECPIVDGVEISEEAINCANRSMGLNKIKGKISFYALDVELHLKNNSNSYQAILVNPPRRGLNSEIITILKEKAPQYIIYSSCNAETLARDYKELEGKYAIVSTQIFDMFPGTSHFETLMLLSRVDKVR